MKLKLDNVKEEDKGILAPCGIICLGCDTHIGEGLDAAKNLKEIWEASNLRDAGIAIGLDLKEINTTLETISKYIEKSGRGGCPGCSKGGFASQFCGIAKCVNSKGYFTCAECDDYDPMAENPCPNEDPNPVPMANRAQMTKMICMRYNKDTCNNLKKCRKMGYKVFIKEAKEKVENGWRTWKVISDEMVFTEAMKK